MDALGQNTARRSAHRVLVALSSALAIAVCSVLWFEGTEVISVWLRGRLQPDSTLLRLLLIYTALQAPWVASSAIAAATNRHRTYAIAYLAASVIFLGVAASLLPHFGLPALAIGLLAGEALACYHWVIRGTCRIIGENYPRFALRLWTGFAGVAATSFIAAWAVHTLYAGPALLRWVLAGGCVLAVSLAMAFLVWLTPADRTLVCRKLEPASSWAGARLSAARAGQSS